MKLSLFLNGRVENVDILCGALSIGGTGAIRNLTLVMDELHCPRHSQILSSVESLSLANYHQLKPKVSRWIDWTSLRRLDLINLTLALIRQIQLTAHSLL